MQPAALLPAHIMLSGIIDNEAILTLPPNGKPFLPVLATFVLPLFFAVSNSFLTMVIYSFVLVALVYQKILDKTLFLWRVIGDLKHLRPCDPAKKWPLAAFILIYIY